MYFFVSNYALSSYETDEQLSSFILMTWMFMFRLQYVGFRLRVSLLLKRKYILFIYYKCILHERYQQRKGQVGKSNLLILFLFTEKLEARR